MSVIYLDNAATTPLSKNVLKAMLPFLESNYGNPSSIYSLGRTNRLAIEESRKNTAQLLGAKPAEIFFTSCGTESSNTVLKSAIEELACARIITSPIEHPATLNTIQSLEKYRGVSVDYVQLGTDYTIDYNHLEKLLSSSSKKTLVSLMHANNEIGTLLDIEKAAKICKNYKALFHTDMVQTIGHYPIDFSELNVDFASGSAHKFHGPKGSGLLYISSAVKLNPLLVGGGQERNMRAGTENVANIVGFGEALDESLANLETDRNYIQELNDYCWSQLFKTYGNNLKRNGTSTGLYTVLNVSFPKNDKTEMIQMALDMRGICVSGGSACSSGAAIGSHVINYINSKPNVPLRISFSKHNTKKEINELINALSEIVPSL